YLFWHHGKPLTLIYEVFSPFLTKYLGPMNLEG
ncbi:MAG: chorismate pyruvate-lyase family protein, partial [Dolichospermum sp.]